MTLIIDRATRAILGCHLSFEVPSHASLQRALAHAFWRKDVSGVEGLENDWPMHGVPFWVFTDNGREFRSRSLRLAEAMLDFGVVNLPAKQPMLKGMVERIFGTMGVQVLSWEDGCTLARSEEYDPAKRATRSLEEIHARLLKWIVDEYHPAPHPALDGQSPLAAWIEKTARFPVPPVTSFDHIIRMTGQLIRRKISNVGVHYEGFLFSNPAHDPGMLERLRVRGGVDHEWMIFVDEYNYGEIWILDDVAGEWLTIENVDPEISVGVSRFQHRLIVLRAKELAAKRSCAVTTRELLDARRELEAEADAVIGNGATIGRTARAARWHTQGLFFTPLYGSEMRSLADPPPDLSAAKAILADAAARVAASPVLAVADTGGDPNGGATDRVGAGGSTDPVGGVGQPDGRPGNPDGRPGNPDEPPAAAVALPTGTADGGGTVPDAIDAALDELIGDWG